MESQMIKSSIIGKTVLSSTEQGTGLFDLIMTDGSKYRFIHYQDCCETVGLEDIDGFLDGQEIVSIEETTKNDDSADATWTFYKITTKREVVTLRFYGESNGYYSESVDFEEYS